MLGLLSELKASACLSILDTVRQRDLSVQEAAGVAGVDVERMRALIERRAFREFALDDLEAIMAALERTEPERKM